MLLLPPFAEELNRARRMLALQARRFAAIGVRALLLDLYGTGDSDGEFGASDWDGWCQDAQAAAQWLRSVEGAPPILLGLRTGALLALAVCRQSPGAASRAILWQPALSGEDVLRQFLRLRLAGDLAASGQEKETLAGLRQRLEAGEALEVAGYTLAPGLAGPLAQARLDADAPPAVARVDWLERAPTGGGDALSRRSAAVVEGWRQAGCDVRTRTYSGDAFWSATELTLAPELIEATTELVRTP